MYMLAAKVVTIIIPQFRAPVDGTVAAMAERLRLRSAQPVEVLLTSVLLPLVLMRAVLLLLPAPVAVAEILAQLAVQAEV
jgi:hypothetical protein